ncbi:yls9-like [Stylosanthes scabra]|uniref:Yls9-like n=1 Tax=Stylosanthes scabra TaxID=79078 RepID=A0ABU6ZSI8_9FABA|nr:yls9-like [Stylosanthes scabra]
MADEKQPPLMNGGYGPLTPPPYNQHRSRNCLCCFFKVLITLIILLGLASLISCLILRPRPLKFSVTNANLTQFNYNSDKKTLDYNLVLNFTARNPNKKLGLYYDYVEANAFYQDVWFSLIDVINWENSFRQSPKSTIEMSGVFKGQQVLFLDESQRSQFDLEKNNHGVFNIFVGLDLKIRYKLGRMTVTKSKSKAKCPIKVALSGDGKIVSPFEPIECDIDVKG